MCKKCWLEILFLPKSETRRNCSMGRVLQTPKPAILLEVKGKLSNV